MFASYVAAALSIIGLGVSLYLTTLQTQGQTLEFCEITSFFSCDRVLTSPYAKFLNIPNSLYGVGWFAVASSAAFLAQKKKWAAKFLTMWSALGIAVVGLLVYVELGLINAVCLLCTIAHLLAVGVAILSVYMYRGLA